MDWGGKGREGAYIEDVLFSHHVSGTQSFQENRHFIFQVGVAVGIAHGGGGGGGVLVACSARISVDRRTDGQNEYCSPRCACASMDNYAESLQPLSKMVNNLL